MRRPLLSACVRGAAALGLFLMLAACALVAYSYALPLPSALLEEQKAGLRVYDRHGLLLSRLRGDGDVWRKQLAEDELGKYTASVLLAAEDARFWSHPGVDPVAMARAAVQAAVRGRIVSGASTITQQLARSCFARPRSLAGKLHELALALRIERSLSKREILLAYLNRVQFGPKVSGMAAASERYLGKPIAALDLGETALLMATVRGPTLYDLERHLDRAKLRRDRILRRAERHGLIDSEEALLALATPVVLRPQLPWRGAWHVARKIARENPGRTEVSSTIDLDLQRRVEDLARRQQHHLSRAGASAVALVVLANESAEVLAYVGSHDETSRRDLGQNDGVTSLRQPGSALKPFLYAAAVDELGFDAETVLPDEPVTFRTPTGHYSPDNFDRRFRGPVPLRRALASSLNVPAVFVLDRLGVARGLDVLHHFGLTSLREDAEHYGLGLALGSGEVTLLDLAAAYSALARGGHYLPVRLLLDGARAAETRAVSGHAARLVTGILADESARAEMFSGLAHDSFAAAPSFALKTGTSSGFRDAWAFVYDDELTVGVWVGNFDGRPMVKTSGAAGAAPLAIEVLSEARSTRSSAAGSAVLRQEALAPRGSSVGAAWSRAPRFLFPVDGARLSLPEGSEGPERAELVVRAAEVPSGARLLLDGQSVVWQGDRAIIRPGPGRHEARLVDVSGHELSAVSFHIALL